MSIGRRRAAERQEETERERQAERGDTERARERATEGQGETNRQRKRERQRGTVDIHSTPVSPWPFHDLTGGLEGSGGRQR